GSTSSPRTASSVRTDERLWLELDSQKLTTDEQLVAALEQRRGCQAHKRSVRGTDIPNREALAGHRNNGVTSGDESIARKRDVSTLAPDEVVSITQARCSAQRPAFELLHQTETKALVWRTPSDGAVDRRSDSAQAFNAEPLSADAKLRARLKRSLVLQTVK